MTWPPEPDDSTGIERELWRADTAERYLDATPQAAAELATNPLVDVCTAREYVRQGCPPATAIALATRERDF